MNKFEFNATFDEIKEQFFLSKYSTIDQFARYSGQWPEGFDYKKLRHWNKEKKEMLQITNADDPAIREQYVKNLVDRTAFTSSILDILEHQVEDLRKQDEPDIKKMNEIIKGMKTLTEIQDEAMKKMKIDSIRDDLFSRNKASIMDELKGKRPKKKVTKL